MIVLLSNVRGYALGVPRTPCNFFSAISSLINGAFSANNQMKAEEAAMERQKDAQAFQKYMTDNYETAEAQRKHYEDAGINSNFMFSNGVGTGSAPASSTASQGSFADNLGLDLGKDLGVLSNYKQSMTQSAKNEAEATRIEALTPSEVKKLGSEAIISEETSRLARENVEIDYQLKQGDLLLKGAQTASQNAQANYWQVQARLGEYDLQEMKPLEKQQLQNTINETLAHIALLKSQKKLTDEQARVAVTQAIKNMMDAVSNRISANASATSADAQQRMASNQERLIPSEINRNEASATASNADAMNKTLDTDTKRKAQRFVLKSFEYGSDLLEQQNSWYATQQIGSFIRDVGVGLGSAVGGFGSAAKSFGAMSIGK